MAKIRKIDRVPSTGAKNYYLVDAGFLARGFINPQLVKDPSQRARVVACQQRWQEIRRQLKKDIARVYIPDICIAEAFKVLAQWRYQSEWFTAAEYAAHRRRLSGFVRTDTRALQSMFRPVKVHDISTNRDIIVSVDRFFEIFFKQKKNVSIPDLIVAATAKYLREFYDIPKDYLHIVTLDRSLLEGMAKVNELPSAYDPTQHKYAASRVFQ